MDSINDPNDTDLFIEEHHQNNEEWVNDVKSGVDGKDADIIYELATLTAIKSRDMNLKDSYTISKFCIGYYTVCLLSLNGFLSIYCRSYKGNKYVFINKYV